MELLDLPRVEGQHDSSAAVTAIGEYLGCPRKYYLSSYLGFDEAARAGVGTGAPSGAELGSEVHQLLAGIELEEPSAEAVSLAESFHRSPLADRLTRASRVEREFGLRVEVEDIVLRGQIDLWFEEAGELVLVDYKTDRHQSHLESYALQLRLYAL
ncbi:MAG: hypothetical protein GY953_45215, partial [bacterium]|nr:hypothetical protein [bacterium]